MKVTGTRASIGVMKYWIVVALACGTTAGCASDGAMNKTGGAVSSAAKQTYRGVGTAVTAPLRDLNLTRQEVPVVLLAAMDAPYQTRTVSDCQSIASEVAALDLTLGPDLDTPKVKRDANYYRLGADEAAEAALDSVKDAAEGLLPYRSWIRQLSGAKANEKRVKEAVYAGSVRRAFLKGIGEHRGCASPAAPLDSRYEVAAELDNELPDDSPVAMGDAELAETEAAPVPAAPAAAAPVTVTSAPLQSTGAAAPVTPAPGQPATAPAPAQPAAAAIPSPPTVTSAPTAATDQGQPAASTEAVPPT
jgi:hypothetical protein